MIQCHSFRSHKDDGLVIIFMKYTLGFSHSSSRIMIYGIPLSRDAAAIIDKPKNTIVKFAPHRGIANAYIPVARKAMIAVCTATIHTPQSLMSFKASTFNVCWVVMV